MKKKIIGALVVLGAVVISAGFMGEELSTQEAAKKSVVPTPQETLPEKEKSTSANDGDGNQEKKPEVQDTGAEEPIFLNTEITDEIFSRMYGKSYKEDCTVPREELRYLKLAHYGFDGMAHQGEMVVNASIADEVLEIFKELYEIQYPIEKMLLIDDYDADDEQSMADNNSSAFNYRVISGTSKLSNHSKGLAIDINPLYNPYVHSNTGTKACEPANAAAYTDRSLEFDHKIDEADACYRIFTEHGFSWGGSWSRSKDYQHFEKVDG